MHTVSEVARLAGVSVRTLHHYDAVGLVRPSARTSAGYRLYSREDLEHLREVLGWRALGFPLADIPALLADGDRRASLQRQRELVAERLDELGRLAAALDGALAALDDHDGTEEVTTMFDGFDADRYEDEARDRWGETDAHRQSVARAAGRGKAEWAEIREEAEAIARDLADLFGAGVAADDPRTVAAALRHRATSSAGSTTARPSCTGGWATCTSRTGA